MAILPWPSSDALGSFTESKGLLCMNHVRGLDSPENLLKLDCIYTAMGIDIDGNACTVMAELFCMGHVHGSCNSLGPG